MTRDLTRGSETRTMILFSLPLILGNLFQQLYNVVDTLVVGRFLGAGALAAVGSSFALMVFLTSVNLGFCMGSGVVFAQLFGANRLEEMKISMVNAFAFIGGVTLLVNLLAFLLLDRLLELLNIHPEALPHTRVYLQIVLCGMLFTFLYNFFAAALRSVGNSLVPLLFLALAAVLNIGLDLLFVLPFGWGIAGAALATVLAQGVSAVAIAAYFLRVAPQLRPGRRHLLLHRRLLRQVIGQSVLVSLQQSVMNFGILMIQGLVNSFGLAAMAAFAAAAKIDSFAYMPAQDFGNAFSTFIAQNYGAGRGDRIQRGTVGAVRTSMAFCLLVSAGVAAFARPLMLLFVQPEETEIIAIGVRYLRIEGAFYCLIGLLFLLYGFYRAVGRPELSLVLTFISLGTRVAVSYLLAPAAGLAVIWWAIPIGWFLADCAGFLHYLCRQRRRLPAWQLENNRNTH